MQNYKPLLNQCLINKFWNLFYEETLEYYPLRKIIPFSPTRLFPRIFRRILFSMTPTSTTWIQPPKNNTDPSVLQIYNTLTKTKVPFISSGRITWYSCGPTVYDAAHIGHARNYVTFDIIRRIFQNYFGFEVFYVMNITDVDDKIILRARQGHLVKQFSLNNPQVNPELRRKLEGYLDQMCAQQARS